MHDERILPTSWVIRHDAPADGVTNMARDLALLETVAPGIATWRWYRWDRPTVSFGRNERTAGWYTPDSVAESGLAVVRRPTGGRALLHARELTYSVTLPLPASVGWRQAYDAINGLLLSVLQGAGIPAAMGEGTSVPPDGLLCFDLPAPGEITVDGCKLVGSAVWRHQECYLQHGSILITDAQPRLLDARVGAAGAPDAAGTTPLRVTPPAAALASLFPTLDDDTIITRVTSALPALLSTHHDAILLPTHATDSDAARRDATLRDVTARHARRMADPAWIWRR